MRLESLSKNVVRVIQALGKNTGLAQLLLYDVYDPFDKTLPPITDADLQNLINPKHEKCRIKPYPFDPDATVSNCSFIRIYYSEGEFNSNEVIAETTLHIDIIVAKDLWLIQGGKIRPYEIMARVIDLVGKRGVGNTIKLKIDGFQHLAVSTQFDAIRLYSEYMTVEA